MKISLDKYYGNRHVIDQLKIITIIQKETNENLNEDLSNGLMNSLAFHSEINNQFENVFTEKKITFNKFDYKTKLNGADIESFFFKQNFQVKTSSLMNNIYYSNEIKMSMFFESSFYFSFSIFLFCFEYKKLNPLCKIYDNIYDFSMEFLQHIIVIAQELLEKNHFDDFQFKINEIKNSSYLNHEEKIERINYHQNEQANLVFAITKLNESILNNKKHFAVLKSCSKSIKLVKELEHLLTKL